MAFFIVENILMVYKTESKPKHTRTIVIQIIAGAYILLFVYAGLSKLLDFQKFKVQIGQSPLLTSLSSWVALLIPSIEILIAFMLIFERYRQFAFYACFSLMVMFTTYIMAITHFSDYIPCSCGGVLQNMSWNQHLVFNIVFIGLSLSAIFLYPKKPVPNFNSL